MSMDIASLIRGKNPELTIARILIAWRASSCNKSQSAYPCNLPRAFHSSTQSASALNSMPSPSVSAAPNL